MTPRLAGVPKQIRTLMDALCAANLLLYLVATFINDFRSFTTDEVVALLVARTGWALVIVGLWLAVRRQGQLGWIIAFYLLALIGTGMDELNMLVMVIVVCYVYLGRRGGHLAVLIALVTYAGPFLFIPSGWSTGEVALIMLRFVAAIVPPTLIGFVLRRHSEALQLLAATNTGLAQANADLRAQASLDQDLLLAEERARAARELHDGLGQRLTVAGMSLDYAARTLPSQPADALAELVAAREVVADTLVDVRSWAQALQPVGGQQPGLAGLTSLIAGFGASGMKIELRLPATLPRLGRRQELFVTRFAQEGLTNALKHARAEQVALIVEQVDDQIELRLVNDGRLPSELVEGFGLRSLRERAAEVGGQITIGADAGQFSLVARLPRAEAETQVGVGGG